jgi:hypothetical protein
MVRQLLDKVSRKLERNANGVARKVMGEDVAIFRDNEHQLVHTQTPVLRIRSDKEFIECLR